VVSSKPIKIAYDPQIWSFQTYGGVSRYFCEVSDRIAKQSDNHVSIVAPFHVNAYLPMLPKGLVSGFRGPQWNIGNRPRRLMAVLAGNAILHDLAPDIIHETYFFPYCLGPRDARRVVTIYDMIHEKFPEFFPRADRTARYKAIAAKRADHVICISESTRRDAIEILGLPIGKTSVIHLGYTLIAANGTFVDEPASPPKEPFLLYVGSRGGYKNFSRLLAAFGASPQLRTNFKLICFGGGAFQAHELQEIDALGLNFNQVAQVGGSDAELEKYYRSAAAFVYPSLYEGFGVPPLEAMSYDCPVICSNAGSIPEVVGNAGEYFDPENLDSLSKAIGNVVGADSRRRFLIAKGRDRLACFSWDRCAADTLAVYLKLV
jgi:glycosyltransferase involved in cell wall biosynthesis